MERLILNFCILLVLSCSSNKIFKVNKRLLTGGSTKYWNVQSRNNVINENSWIFRKNGTFSYYDPIEYKEKGTFAIMEWLSYDIKVGTDGIIPWILTADTLEISRIKYNVLKLTKDSLIVETPYSKFGPIDTLLFTPCLNCK